MQNEECFMNIHEYQAKEILKKYGAPVSKGGAAFNLQEVEAVAKELDAPLYVVKSQIHAGGRGKGYFKEFPQAKGGVRVVKTIPEVISNAKEMLGSTLVTIQTGEEGKQVNQLYIEYGTDIKKEFYLSLLVDRESSKVAFIASSEGGVDIEEVAHNHPEKIITKSIDPAVGISGYHVRSLAKTFGLKDKEAIKSLASLLNSLYRAFVETDAAQIEINPLVLTQEGRLIILDAKIGFDDNALYRHPNIEALRDESEEEPTEREAGKSELSYVKMDGNIGCMVNGAGLAMSTMDIIKLKGGEPANFLDVGGGATKERVIKAFKIILSDKNVKAVLVNIFGGIMRCDIIANGVVEAAREISLSVPLVVRLEGTNVDEGKAILKQSGLDIISADDLEDAAQKVVETIGREAA